jgi:hypothetical protein
LARGLPSMTMKIPSSSATISQAGAPGAEGRGIRTGSPAGFLRSLAIELSELAQRTATCQQKKSVTGVTVVRCSIQAGFTPETAFNSRCSRKGPELGMM